MRLVVTGAAGSIGRVVGPALAELGHQVVGVDLVERPDGIPGAWVVADCADPGAVEDMLQAAAAACDGPPEAVVHLAGRPDEASLPEELDSHVLTTAALTDAMVRHGIGRIVYASSNHAVGLVPAGSTLTVDVPVRPDTHYGVAKVAAEALLRMVVDRYAVDAVVARIGSFLPQPETRRQLATWLSHDDAVRLVHAGVTAPSPGYAVVHGISANTRGWWDMSPGHAIGFHPEDDAEAHAARIESQPETEQDRAELAVVGGPVALPHYHRPALDEPRR